MKLDYVIREIKESEYSVLNDFLYEAIFIPEGTEPPPRSIIENEELQVYVRDFGKLSDDKCLVAEKDGKIVGAVWTRIMNDYGHIDDSTPSLAISLYRDYRSLGIGTDLMKRMLELLKNCGYKQVSLSVQKANYAVKLYLDTGFEIISENDEEYIMVRKLDGLTFKRNELTAEDYIELWNSVWDGAPSLEQTRLALEHTLFRVSIYDGEKPIAMARMIGDMGICYYIKDVVVRPEYQKKGIGRMLINELLKFVNENGIEGSSIFVELCAMPDKIPFYEKFGFSANEAQRLKMMYEVRPLINEP